MNNKIQLDVISDVVCPWCIVGYKNLEKAIKELGIENKITLQWQPFELNASMPPEGQELSEHVMEKYGSTLAESKQTRIDITQRGKEAGFTFNFFDGMKIVNTRDAHILLEYAHELGKQTDLKLRLFSAVFTEKKDISNREVLLKEAAQVGLEREQAKLRLESKQHREALINQEVQWQQAGVSAVPTVVFNRTSAMSGAQPVAAYKEVLTELLAAL